MKVVFDVLGSTEKSGGMRLHSREMIWAWIRQWPDDELLVVGPQWAAEEFRSSAQVRVWRNESALFRSFGQLFTTWYEAHRFKADALVSLSPIVAPLAQMRTVCFQHDWRHKVNPHEFPRLQRLYRKLWELSARRASFNACISQKAIDETLEFVPRARTVLIENGWDHASAWPQLQGEKHGDHLITFGHHNNKRPELAMEAFARMSSEGRHPSRLVVLGARGDYADELRVVAKGLGVEDVVEFPGFVSDTDYQRLVSTALAVVMPSTDEGFGLPVAEALFLGIPAVVTDDSGMAEIFGSAVWSSAPDAEALSSTIRAALAHSGSASGNTAAITTWEGAARKLREAIRR